MSTVLPAGWRRRRGRPGGSTPSCGTKRTGVLAAAEKGGTFSPTAAPTYAPTAVPLRPDVSAGGSYHCGPRVVRLRQYPGEGRMGRCARMRGACTPKGYSPCSHLGTSVRHYPTELCTGTARARWGRPARRRPARSARRGTPPRGCQALSLTGIPSCSRVLQGYPRDTLAKVLGFGGVTPSAPWVRCHRTYSDEEGLPQCRRCPGDKNYTIVKVRSPTLP